MSAEKCGPVLTAEMIQQAAERSIDRGGEPVERIIGTKAQFMLMKIWQKEPGWDSWSVPGEIFLKARSLGLLDEE